MGRSSRAAAVAGVAATLFAAAGALAADPTLTTDTTAANASAHNGDVVWSRVDVGGQSHLVQRVFARPRDVPARPKDGLFDPDLGTSRRGHRVIVYTRCAGLSGQGCDIWQYDVSSRRERKVPGASSKRCSEFAPSVWISKFAFARSGPRGCNGLFVLRRAVHGRKRRLRLDGRVPADTDLRGNRVAYLYVPAGDPSRTFVRVRLFHGASHIVVAGSSGRQERSRVSSPVLDGAYVYWIQQDLVRREFFLGRNRITVRGAPLEFGDRTLPGRVESIAVTRGIVFYTNGHGLFRATDPLVTFAPRD
jgi:hypothetical protein